MPKAIGNQFKFMLVLEFVFSCVFLFSCKSVEFSTIDKLFSRNFQIKNQVDDLKIYSLEKYTYNEDLTDDNLLDYNDWCIYIIKYYKFNNQKEYNTIYTYCNNSFSDLASLNEIDLWKNDFPKTYEIYTDAVINGNYIEYKKYNEEEWIELLSMPIYI